MTTPTTTKTDLLLLGLLVDRPMHGYELYQQIQAEGIDGWFHISPAGVYYSLRKLRDQGLVAESRQRLGGGSRKSVYRLTEKGRTAFFEEMEAALASQEKICLDYDLAIYLLSRLPLKRVLPQLELRQAFLAEQAREVQAALIAEQSNGSSPSILAILDHRRRFLEMEQNWLTAVLRGIGENGEAGHVPEGIRPGLMILRGDLHDFHLPDLVRLIMSGRHSGTLTASDGAEILTLLFKEGAPICASARRRSDPTAPPSQPDQVLDRLCELFRWQEGWFTFDQRSDCEEQAVPLECSAEELILRGCRKVDNWATIQRLVPSTDTIFELGSVSPRLERLALRRTEERVMAAVDGIKDVTTIAHDLNLTLFEVSRVFYCLTAIGVLRTADRDKIWLRRVFREIAELMCNRTLALRTDPDERSCEEEVNELCGQLPLRLSKGRIEDQTDPQLGIDQLREMYHLFLREQFRVVSRRLGWANARETFEQVLHQLAPALQDVARRHGFDRLAMD